MTINDDKTSNTRQYNNTEHKYEIVRCPCSNNDTGLIVIKSRESEDELDMTLDQVCNTMLDDFPKQQRGMLQEFRRLLVKSDE